MIKPGGKDVISKYKKNMAVNQLNFFCEESYVDMTSRKFSKRIKEHIPKSIDKFWKMSQNKNNSIR